MTPADLTRLRQDATVVLGPLSPLDFPGEPVNWANLRCVESSWVVPDTGSPYASVLIEEADPSATGLCMEVSKRLARRGWPDISVRTEW